MIINLVNYVDIIDSYNNKYLYTKDIVNGMPDKFLDAVQKPVEEKLNKIKKEVNNKVIL